MDDFKSNSRTRCSRRILPRNHPLKTELRNLKIWMLIYIFIMILNRMIIDHGLFLSKIRSLMWYLIKPDPFLYLYDIISHAAIGFSKFTENQLLCASRPLTILALTSSHSAFLSDKFCFSLFCSMCLRRANTPRVSKFCGSNQPWPGISIRNFVSTCIDHSLDHVFTHNLSF